VKPAIALFVAIGCGGSDSPRSQPPADGGSAEDAAADAAPDASAPIPCATDDDCAAPEACIFEDDAWVCGPPGVGGGPSGGPCETDDNCRSRLCGCRVCSAACADDAGCAPGMICSDGACGFAPLDTDPQVDEIPLGTVSIVRAFGGAASDPLAVAVPCDAVSLTLNALEDSDDVPVQIRFDLVEAPDGELLMDLALLFSGVDQPLWAYPYPGWTVMTMLVPNSTEDRIAFGPGTYGWRHSSFPTDGGEWPDVEVEVTALVKRTERALDAGTLDLNVWPVGLGFSAAEAPDRADLQETLATVETVYAQVGISLGDVAYFDPPPEEVARLEVIDRDTGPDSELSDLYRLSAGREGFVVDLFLVRSLSGILGIAGGVPGPAGLHGTARSGVVAVADPALVTPEQLGGIVAHEIGHYLGLYHSTGSLAGPDGDDNIADTVTGDDTNLMWPAALNVSRNLTAGQGFVMRRNPLVR